MDIEPIDLTIGPELQKYLDIMEWAQKEYEKALWKIPPEYFGKKESKTLGSED